MIRRMIEFETQRYLSIIIAQRLTAPKVAALATTEFHIDCRSVQQMKQDSEHFDWIASSTVAPIGDTERGKAYSYSRNCAD